MPLRVNLVKLRAWKERSAKRAQEKARSKSARAPGRKPVPRKNRKRAAAFYDRNFGVDGRRGEAVRAMGCKIAGVAGHVCDWKIDACHSAARGMGGAKGDSGSLWNGCRAAHLEAGERGTEQREAFIERYGGDPEVWSAEIKAELDDRFGPEPCYRCGETSRHAPLCPTVEGRAAAQALTRRA